MEKSCLKLLENFVSKFGLRLKDIFLLIILNINYEFKQKRYYKELYKIILLISL